MTASSKGPEDRRRRRHVRAATITTTVLLGAILLLGAPLRTGAAPLGIVSLQYATSPASADSVLTSWESVPRSRLLWAHGLDLLLPVAYAVAIVTAARDAVARCGVAARAAGAATGAAIVAGVADQVENVAMGVTLLASPSWASVLVTLAAATVKWAMLLIAIVSLVSVLLAARSTRGVVR